MPGHPKKEEQGIRLDIGTWNRLLEGLPTSIGVPKSDGSRSDFTYKEDAPFVATGPFIPTGYRNGVPNQMETDQLTCRLKIYELSRPAPDTGLNRNFKPCPLCWSRWLLDGQIQWSNATGHPLDTTLQKMCNGQRFDVTPTVAPEPSGASPPAAAAASTASGDFFNQLQSLMEWRRNGLLSEDEFGKAKQKLGLA